jgi:hypothetical protein
LAAGSVSLQQVVRKVTKKIENIPITIANTEQSFVFPTTIYGYLIKVRNYTAEIKLSHVSGESGTKYLTVPKRASYEDLHAYQNTTLYFQSSIACTIELVYWV